MGAIRSVLWIGAAKDFPAGPLSKAPSLDVVWERDLVNVRALPDAFDAVVLDAAHADAALRDLSLLRDGPARGAVLVRLDAHCAERRDEIAAAGAADVVLRSPEPDGYEAFARVVDRLEALGSRSGAFAACAPAAAPAFGAAPPPLVGRTARPRADRARRALERHGAGERRNRHRQGAGRARHPPARRALRRALRGLQLRRAPRVAAGERAAGAHARRLHRDAPIATGSVLLEIEP
jgi:hypothetical protein